MKTFITRHASPVTCVLSGFDRLMFRGTLMPLVIDGGMHVFLSRAKVRLLDFKHFALRTSERVREAALAEAQRRERPVRYLASSGASKEDLARTLLAQHPPERPGLVCSFKAVEPCRSFEYHRSPDPQARGLKLKPRKCLHIYHYLLHPIFGFMNVRIQTWFPFNIQICLNGREWLARQLARRGSRFDRADNCFPRLANPALAQRLMDEQLATDWPAALTALARSINPLHDEIFEPWPMDYYWSGYQTEWATDVLFNDPQALATIYPALVHHAIDHFKSPDVMRFLGQKLHGNFKGEVISSFKERPEGVTRQALGPRQLRQDVRQGPQCPARGDYHRAHHRLQGVAPKARRIPRGKVQFARGCVAWPELLLPKVLVRREDYPTRHAASRRSCWMLASRVARSAAVSNRPRETQHSPRRKDSARCAQRSLSASRGSPDASVRPGWADRRSRRAR